MAIEISLARRGKTLIPVDPQSLDALMTIGAGEMVRATIKRPRNIMHHRQFFALMHVLFEAQDLYPTFDHFMEAVKIAIGHFDEFQIGNKSVIKTRSISFAKMDQTDFEEFYERTVRLTIERILPGINSDDLKEEVNQILNGRQGASYDFR